MSQKLEIGARYSVEFEGTRIVGTLVNPTTEKIENDPIFSSVRDRIPLDTDQFLYFSDRVLYSIDDEYSPCVQLPHWMPVRNINLKKCYQ